MGAQADSITFVLVHGAWHGGWCFDRLASRIEARGQQNSTSLWREPYPRLDLPTVRSVYIAGIHDRTVTLPWARYVASTRLGVNPIELPCGHSGFLSHPDLLTAALIEQAT